MPESCLNVIDLTRTHNEFELLWKPELEICYGTAFSILV